MTRTIWLLVWSALILATRPATAADAPRPNVLLILTDDQGWGDVGFHGNPTLKTPHLDRLAEQSTELARFHVCPVCSPTRASLLTGRYNYRTGAIDTYLGRSTMAADETTLAEILSAAGYQTGIFGKWHLGDNYPSRPQDQGFERTLVHRGGGIGQPADPPGNAYFDPVLLDDGREVKKSGYCSDVFTDAAIAFVREQRERPFFAYLAFNCPHSPLQVPAAYHSRYQGLSLDDDTARLYGMVANIDDNVGRLLAAIEELGLAASTIVIFMTDNGPQSRRYNGDLNGLKGSVFDGGIRVPCLMRWPGKFAAGRKTEAVAAHIDVAPTLLEACGIERPMGIRFDGISLAPLLLGRQSTLDDRMLFFQWHRGDVPVSGRACAVRSARYKLMQPLGRDDQNFEPAWALYDMLADPGERHNILAARAEIAVTMKEAYRNWFDDVSATRGYPAPRIIVGTKNENPTTLTRQDWRGTTAGWRDENVGHWEVDVTADDVYDITVRIPAFEGESLARLRIGGVERKGPIAAGLDRLTFSRVALPAGRVRVEATAESAGKVIGAHYVDLLAQGAMAQDR
jgi:arylsulfatase A-like enzyme